MMRTILMFLGLTGSILAAEAPLVVLATARSGQVDVLDSVSLAKVGHLAVHSQAESSSLSATGRYLYVAQAETLTPQECCSLFSVDLATRRMCRVKPHAMFGTPSPDGRYLFTQASPEMLDVFDMPGRSLQQSIKAAGYYNLQPSPDGHWLFGITNSPTRSLDMADRENQMAVKHIALPLGPATGAWVGETFYIFVYGSQGGLLWAVKPNSTVLLEAMPVHLLPSFHGNCAEPVLLMLAGSHERLFLAEAFGHQVDRRSTCGTAVRGGIYVIDPAAMRVENRIGQGLAVNRMVVSPDGSLYVIDAGGTNRQGNARVLHLDSSTGQTLATHELDAGVWNLAVGRMPGALIPRGTVTPVACR